MTKTDKLLKNPMKWYHYLAGYLLFRVSRINSKRKLGLFIFFAGMILISIMCSITFMDKAK